MNINIKNKKHIVFILPVYNEFDGIAVFHEQLIEKTRSLLNKYKLKFIYINDGSRDGSAEILREIYKTSRDVELINFSRNYGHQIAITAGIDKAGDADAAVIMDTDLQDPPEVVLKFVTEWEKGAEVVYGQRRSRLEGIFKKFSAYIFYRLLSIFAEVRIPKDTGDFRLIDQKVIRALQQYREHNRFMRGIVASMGFNQVPVLFDRPERYAGTTHYPFRKMLKLAIDGIISFSNYPLVLINNISLFLAGISIVWAVFILVRAVYNLEITGELLLGFFICCLTSLQMFAIGVVGNYIGRIHQEVLNRPLYLVSEHLKH